MRALVLAEIPNPHIAPPITTDELPLVRVDDHIIDRHSMRVVALYAPRACIPDLDRAVLGRCHHPFPLAVERNAGDVGRVAFKGEHGVRVRGLDFVELDRVVARGREEALVRRDAEAIHLRIGVWDGATTDTGEGFPEAIRAQRELAGGRDARGERPAYRMV